MQENGVCFCSISTGVPLARLMHTLEASRILLVFSKGDLSFFDRKSSIFAASGAALHPKTFAVRTAPRAETGPETSKRPRKMAGKNFTALWFLLCHSSPGPQIEKWKMNAAI